MRPARINKAKIASFTRPLIATALVAGGLFQAAAPVLADIPITGPLAKDQISNTATASYEDPNDPTGTPINTVSNTVTIVVAKVAGIVVQAKGFSQPTGTTFAPGEQIYSNFDVVNTGNDGVQFKVPKSADFTGNVTFNKVEYLDGATWKTADDTTPSQIIAVGTALKVRIVLTIKADALANDPIVTTLGHTSTAPLGKDNVARGINGEDTDNDRDIYTVDVATTGALVKIAGVAANGTREASAQQQIAVKAQKQAFATIDLTHDTAVQKTATTDEVKYNLSVTVPNLAPAGSGKTATDLAPTPIKLATAADPATGSGTDVNRVILSYALPTGSSLDSIAAPTAAPVLPDGSNGVWTPVYLTSTGVWSTVKPVTGTITEVGFILEAATSTGTPTVDGPSLPMNGGTPYTGFSVKVLTTALGTYASTAKIEGTTPGADGKADPSKLVLESDTDSITTTRTVATVIYNGPSQKPQAKGPGGDNNTDFTNKSMAIPSGQTRDNAGVLVPIAGSNVTFTNTVENSTIDTADVYLLPTPPTVKLPGPIN